MIAKPGNEAILYFEKLVFATKTFPTYLLSVAPIAVGNKRMGLSGEEL